MKNEVNSEEKYIPVASEILQDIIEADEYESIHELAPVERETFEKIIARHIYNIFQSLLEG